MWHQQTDQYVRAEPLPQAKAHNLLPSTNAAHPHKHSSLHSCSSCCTALCPYASRCSPKGCYTAETMAWCCWQHPESLLSALTSAQGQPGLFPLLQPPELSVRGRSEDRRGTVQNSQLPQHNAAHCPGSPGARLQPALWEPGGTQHSQPIPSQDAGTWHGCSRSWAARDVQGCSGCCAIRDSRLKMASQHCCLSYMQTTLLEEEGAPCKYRDYISFSARGMPEQNLNCSVYQGLSHSLSSSLFSAAQLTELHVAHLVLHQSLSLNAKSEEKTATHPLAPGSHRASVCMQ